MSVEDKERLEAELKSRVLQTMNGLEELGEFFKVTLKNFGYRYIESESTGEVIPFWADKKTLLIEVKEGQLANALKTDNPNTRKGLIDLAKSFSKKDKPEVRYQLGVKILNVNSQGGGEFQVFAETHGDLPNCQDSEKKNSLSRDIVYEDSLDLRNNFARILEDVCGVL